MIDHAGKETSRHGFRHRKSLMRKLTCDSAGLYKLVDDLGKGYFSWFRLNTRIMEAQFRVYLTRRQWRKLSKMHGKNIVSKYGELVK